MHKKILIVVALILTGLLFEIFLGAPADAESNPTIIFILDASGSMWGRVGKDTKIEAARNVLGKLLSGLPENTRFGLVAYGHRHKGDCQDIEMIALPGASEKTELVQDLNSLNPKGKTPLAASLIQVGDYVKDHENETTVVLVSDGLETCGGDPCSVAKKLHQQGIKVVIHVVGFDVSGAAAEQLRCIAEAGGGQYFQADTSESLAEALTAVSDHVAKGTALPGPPPQPKVKANKAKTKRIKVSGPGTIELASATWVAMPPYYWLVVDAETGAEVARSKSEILRVKPGTYQIVWRQDQHGAGEVMLNEVVTVKSGKKITVPLTTGIRITVPENVNPPYSWKLVDDAGEVDADFGGNLNPQLVPPGTYRLIWRQTEHAHGDVDLGKVTIEPGKLKELMLDFGIVVTLPDWLKPPYYFTLLDEQGHQIRMNEVGTQIIPPGTYQLCWKQTEHGFSEIKWGEVRTPSKGFAEIAIDSGLTFLAGDTPKPYRIYVENTTTGDWAEMADSWGPMPLPPGTYKVDMQDKQHGGARVTLIDELPIQKGELVELEL